jgi:hypothetical protein
VGLIIEPIARADTAIAPERGKLSPRAEIHQKLTKKIDWKFQETPLAEVAEFLKKDLDIPVHLDARSLRDLDVLPDTPISFKLSGVAAKTALKYLLRDVGLTFCSYGEVLLITTPEEAENAVYAEVYEVTDLVCADKENSGDADFDSLADLICKSIKPTAWGDCGGPGPISPIKIAGTCALVFEQTEEVHEEVAELLAELRAVRHFEKSRVKSEPPILPVGLELKRVAWEKIRSALDKKVSIHFSKTPLAEVAATLEKESGMPILLDHRAINDLSSNPSDISFTFDCKGLELQTALNLMFRDVALTWAATDEIVQITSHEQEDNEILTLVYDVSDLPAYRMEKGGTLPDFDHLIDSITRNIHSSSWNNRGGYGSIEQFDMNGIQALVISQTWRTHEKVRALLDGLHKLHKNPLSKEQLEMLPLEPVNPIPNEPPNNGTSGMGGGFM